MNDILNTFNKLKVHCPQDEYSQLKVISQCLDSYIFNNSCIPDDLHRLVTQKVELYLKNIDLNIVYPENYINYQVEILKKQIQEYKIYNKSPIYSNQIFKTLIKIVDF